MWAIGSLSEFEETIEEFLEIASPYLQGEDIQVLHCEMQPSNFSIWVFAATGTRGLILNLDGVTDPGEFQTIEHFGPFPISDVKEISAEGPQGMTCVILEDDVFIKSGQVQMGKTRGEALEELRRAIKSLSP